MNMVTITGSLYSSLQPKESEKLTNSNTQIAVHTIGDTKLPRLPGNDLVH